MDRLDVMRLFTRIVERQSFTLAAQDLECRARPPRRSSRSWKNGWACGCCSAPPGMSGRRWMARRIYRAASRSLATSRMPRPPSATPSRAVSCASMSMARWHAISCYPVCPRFWRSIRTCNFIGRRRPPRRLVREGIDCVLARRRSAGQRHDRASRCAARRSDLRQPGLCRTSRQRPSAVDDLTESLRDRIHVVSDGGGPAAGIHDQRRTAPYRFALQLTVAPPKPMSPQPGSVWA
jgi:hypothetical protein